MMQCAHTGKLLSAYAENELNIIQRWQVAWHLRGCERCQAQLGEWKMAAQYLATLREAEPPPDLLSRITEAVDAAPDVPLSFSPSPARPQGLLLAWSWVMLAALGLAPFIASAICQNIAANLDAATSSLAAGAELSWGVRELLLWCLLALARLVVRGAEALNGVFWGVGENHLSALMTWEVIIWFCGLALYHWKRRGQQTLMSLVATF